MPEPAIQIEQLRFGWPDQSFALDIPAWQVARRERVFLVGASGSGKTTLLNLLAGIHKPDTGRLAVLGTELQALGSGRRDHFRADHIGLVFQQFNLLPYLDVLDNVLLPCRFSRQRRLRAESRGHLHQVARDLLTDLALPPQLLRRDVTRLSVGQQQRVAVARALIGAPELIIADEPTSALDSDHRDRFIELLLEQAELAGSTILFVSHDRALARHFDRVDDMNLLNHWQGAA